MYQDARQVALNVKNLCTVSNFIVHDVSSASTADKWESFYRRIDVLSFRIWDMILSTALIAADSLHCPPIDRSIAMFNLWLL